MITLARREFHQFQAAGREFLYLVPSAAVFELDEPSAAVLGGSPRTPAVRTSSSPPFQDRFPRFRHQKRHCSSLLNVRAIGYEHQPDEPAARMLPMAPFPLTTMVLNVTNQCNLACTYCYEYGEDKIVDTEHGKQSKFMSEATARAERRVPAEGKRPRRAHDLFRRRDAAELSGPEVDGRVRARSARPRSARTIDFSLTTNATLLQLGDHRVPRRERRSA